MRPTSAATLVTKIRRYRARDGLAAGYVELCTMHGAGKVGAVERAQLKRRIHVAAAPLDGVVVPPQLHTTISFPSSSTVFIPPGAISSAAIARTNLSLKAHVLRLQLRQRVRVENVLVHEESAPTAFDRIEMRPMERNARQTIFMSRTRSCRSG